MFRSSVSLAALCLLLPMCVWGQDPKSPPPPDQEQEKIRKDLREAYKIEYSRKGREDKKAFAAKLWAEAGTAKTALEKFVILQECRGLAAESLDLETALGAVDALVRTFDLKPEPLRSAAVAVARKAIRGEEDTLALADMCMSGAQRAWKASDFTGVGQLAGLARELAQGAREPALAERARAMVAEAAETKKEFEKAIKADEALAANKEDAEAHAERGRFHCLLKGDWTLGLPSLEKAADPLLRDLAAKEKLPPVSGEGLLELANGWTDWGAKEKAPYKRKCQERALHWIEQAWPKLGDREKAKLERRLDELEASVGRVNLMLARTSIVSGVWGVTPQSLRAPTGTVGSLLEILYTPPLEYDLELVVNYQGIPTLIVGLMAGSTRFSVNIDNRNGSGIGLTSSKPIEGTHFAGEALPEGKPVSVVFSVRRDGLSVAANGKTIMRYRGPLTGLAFDANTWKPKNPGTLWLGYRRNFAGAGDYEVTQMTLLPIGGRGVRLR